jgi:hypothetical protein
VTGNERLGDRPDPNTRAASVDRLQSSPHDRRG